jgi:hypothetical protein
MGPFSNNTPPPPPNPSSGNKLPTPDVNAPQQTVVVEVPEDQSRAVKKWFAITLWIAGSMAALGIIVLAAYLIISNTPNYMLGVATQNLFTSGGAAGNFVYETTGKRGASATNGDFLLYSDPTDPQKSSVTAGFGQGASRVSTAILLSNGTNYVQTAGLGNLKRLLDSARIDSSSLATDELVRLSSLDGQWYSLTADDAEEVDQTISQHTLRGAVSPSHISKIADLYQKNAFIKVLQQYSDEPINTIQSMHLRIGVDGPKFAAFIRSVKAAAIASINVTEADITTLERFSLDPYTIEVWISRSDRTFQQWKVTSKQPSDIAVTTINFKSDAVATARQAVQQPQNVRSMSVFVTSLRDIVDGQPLTH